MAKKLSRAEVTTATTGTSDVTVGSATARARSLIDAGAVNGDILELVIADDNGNWEFDHYPYSSGVLTRSGNPLASSNSGSRINLSGSAKVFSDLFAENILGNTALSPAQVTANQNDWDPSDSVSSSKFGTVIRFSTDAARNITGFKAYPNAMRILVNVGSNDALFQDEGSSTASSAENRFAFGSDIYVKSKETIIIIYDSTSSRWRAVGGTALRQSGVTAGSYGSSSAIPNITVDGRGRITSISTSALTVDMVRITESAASSSASLDFTGLDTSTYKAFMLVFKSVIPATTNTKIWVRVGTGSTTFQSSSYINNTGGTTALEASQTASTDAVSTINTGQGINGVFLISNLAAAAAKVASGLIVSEVSGTPKFIIGGWAGYWNSTTAITALQVLFSSGNIASGSVELWGMK